MNRYEVAIIVRPDVDEEGQKAVIERVSAILTKDGGQVEKVDTWGRRHLAYPIKKTQEGIYFFVQGQFAPSALPELERTFKLSEDVLRHMVVRLDK